MTKDTRKYISPHKAALKKILQKYDVSVDMVYKSIRGERKSAQAVAIKSDYDAYMLKTFRNNSPQKIS